MPVSCQLCSRESPIFLTAQDYNQGLSEAEFAYYRCPSCKIIFLSPVPDNLQDYYSSSYPAYQMPSLSDLNKMAEEERYKLDIVQQYAASGKLLEIGPAYGGFAYLAKKAGFEVDAIEMDAGCSAYLNTVIGVRCINDANIETALHMLDTSFDVIVMWHVIEHLTNPWLILEEISRKLKPEGVLVIAAPNPEALPFKTFGKYWTHLDAPRHLELIPKQLLSDHAHRYGLEEIFSSTKDKASIVFSSFGWWMVSFRNAVRDILHWPVTVNQEVTDTSPPRKINSCTLMALARSFGRFSAKAIRAIIMMVLRIFYKVILQPLERTEGRGNAYTVVYRKSR